MAGTKKDALAAFDVFVQTWGVKYEKAVECLVKDRNALLAFYDLLSRALEASAHDQRYRKLVCDRAPSHRALQRMPVEQDGARDDLQARRGR